MVDGSGNPVTDGNFEIVGDEIRVKAGATIDYETATSHDLRVQVTDSGGNSYAEDVTVTVNDLNEAPTDITVGGGAVDENAVTGTVVATLSAVDADAGDTFTYALVDGSGNPVTDGNFEIVGNEIRVKAGATIDYEAATSHDLRVQVTDAGGNSYAEDVTLHFGTGGDDSITGGSAPTSCMALAGAIR